MEFVTLGIVVFLAAYVGNYTLPAYLADTVTNTMTVLGVTERVFQVDVPPNLPRYVIKQTMGIYMSLNCALGRSISKAWFGPSSSHAFLLLRYHQRRN